MERWNRFWNRESSKSPEEKIDLEVYAGLRNPKLVYEEEFKQYTDIQYLKFEIDLFQNEELLRIPFYDMFARRVFIDKFLYEYKFDPIPQFLLDHYDLHGNFCSKEDFIKVMLSDIGWKADKNFERKLYADIQFYNNHAAEYYGTHRK